MPNYNFKNPYNPDQKIMIKTYDSLYDEFKIGHVAKIYCPEVGMTFLVSRHAMPLEKNHCYHFHFLVHPMNEMTFKSFDEWNDIRKWTMKYFNDMSKGKIQK